MTRARTITLEFLREGPPHNQLLSPLTRYLAACQNRPPESLRLDVEHRDFLRWQAGLTYANVRRLGKVEDEKTRVVAAAAFEVERRNAIDDAGKAVTNVLGAIKGLTAELSCEPCEWRHIHLVVDASELGALPFELARAAPGLMVEGERLFAQQNARITLSRQTRRVATSVVSWPERPRILCVIADGDLPADAHVLALRKSIDHWIGWNDLEGSATGEEGGLDENLLLDNRKREAARMLTVLENPTLDEVSQAAAADCFTHVHVLAHGAPLPDASAGQTLYGICFRGTSGVDVVDGDRLEAALRHPKDCTHPTVVTLATCEGASVTGAILGPGGSAAHQIHSKGVPLVIASQFPLSKGASVVATEMLYRGLLRGDDPRETVHAIRRELLVVYPDTHDWASLVVYASLPPDLDAQLGTVRRNFERRAAETAIERFRATLRGKSEQQMASGSPDEQQRVGDDIDRLDETFARIRAAIDGPTKASVDANRFLGRLAMRLYDAYVFRSPPFGQAIATIAGRTKKHDFTTGRRPISMLAPNELLKLAKDSYLAAHGGDGSQWELWLQVVALCWALELDGTEVKQFDNDLTAARYMSDLLVERAGDAIINAAQQRALAACFKFEVELLAYLAGHTWDVRGTDMSESSFGFRLDELFDKLVRAVSPVPESYRAHAAWRQLRRYGIWVQHRWTWKQPDRQGVAPGRIARYSTRLQELGVRRYWGPRDHRSDQDAK